MVRNAYSDLNNAHLGGPSLWRFYNEMAVGDLVIVGDGRRRHIVMRVTGHYEWSRSSLPVPGDYYHQRAAELSNDDADEVWARCGGEAIGENIRWTVLRCDNADWA
jgi:hypothetical protein